MGMIYRQSAYTLSCVGSGLVLQAVTKRYSRRGRWVLRGVSLEAPPGTLHSIAGVNGSGKSTLLRIAAGLTSPSSGRALVPSRVGYVPECQPARLKFTAAEYLENLGRMRGMRTRAVVERGSELLERLGLQPNSDVPWETLSKGNRQKVLVAQAFLGPTDLVVLDEPYSGLDDRAVIALDELIAETLSRETALLISTHRTQDPHNSDHLWQLESAGLVEISPFNASAVGIQCREEANRLDHDTRPLSGIPEPIRGSRNPPKGWILEKAGAHGVECQSG